MKSKENKIQLHFEKYFLPILIFNCLLLLLLIYLVVTSAHVDTAQTVLRKSVDNLINNHKFQMSIQENSQDYKLEFQGKVSGNNIYGVFLNYELEIYRVEDKIFIKDHLTQQWKEIEELSLDGLYTFLRTPGELLSTFNEEFSKAKFGPDENINGKTYKTIYFSGGKNNLIEIYPEIEGVNEYMVYMWIEREELMIDRIALLVSLPKYEHKEKTITRWFLIKPEVNLSLPALPEEIKRRL